jgi:hypothetical protein
MFGSVLSAEGPTYRAGVATVEDQPGWTMKVTVLLDLWLVLSSKKTV